MNSKKFLAFTMAAAMTLSLAACGGGGGSSSNGSASTGDTSGAGSSSTAESSGNAFKVGATGPLTGGASIYGLAAYHGAQIAVDEIREAGGDIQFELRYEDDQNVPETAGERL